MMEFCEGIEGSFLKSEMWEGLILVVLVGQIFCEYYKGGTMETMMTSNLVMEISLLSHFCDYLFADAGYALLELFK